MGSVCAAATVVEAGALDVGTVGLFVLSRCSSFGDDTYGTVILLDWEYVDAVTVEGLVLSTDAVLGVVTVSDGAGVDVAAEVEVVIVASLAALVGDVRAAVGLVPVVSALRVGVLWVGIVCVVCTAVLCLSVLFWLVVTPAVAVVADTVVAVVFVGLSPSLAAILVTSAGVPVIVSVAVSA